MFEKCVALIAQYELALESERAPYVKDLATEFSERLRQLDYVIGRVRTLEPIALGPFFNYRRRLFAHAEGLKRRAQSVDSEPMPRELWPSDLSHLGLGRADFDAASKAQFDLKLLTESFYYLAGRIRTITKAKKHLPGLSAFEGQGVRDVRNKLLEHVEGPDSQVWVQSFSMGGEGGPVLKASRPTHLRDVFPDRGLYVNAREFAEELEQVLQARLGYLHSS